MTTYTHRRKPKRRRHTKRSPGFIAGFRRITYTDHLRHRLGGAAGRGMIRIINRRRVRRGRTAIPVQGDWYTLPKHVKHRTVKPSKVKVSGPHGVHAPNRSGISPAPAPKIQGATQSAPNSGATAAKLRKGAGKAAKRIVGGPTIATTKGRATGRPAFSGPYVKVRPGRLRNLKRRTWPGTVSVTTTTGGGNQPVQPRRRNQGIPVNHPWRQPVWSPAASSPATSPTTIPVTVVTTSSPKATGTGTGWPTGPASTPAPSARGADSTTQATTSSTPTATGGTTVSTNTGGSVEANAIIAAAPDTDAEYVSALRDMASRMLSMSEDVESIQASLIEALGFDPRVTQGYDKVAEGLQQAAEGVSSAITDFLTTYAGVIETAQKGVKIPGDTKGWWTGDVS